MLYGCITYPKAFRDADVWVIPLNDLGGDCAELKGRFHDENRDQKDRKFRRSSASSRIDAAARPQARSGTAHYRTRWRWISGNAVRSRLREDHGNSRSDYGQIQGHARGARKISGALP